MNLPKTIYTNVAVANLYKESRFTSAIVSQSTLWEKLTVSKEKDSFYNVVCEDDYQGWIHKSQVAVSTLSKTEKFMTLSQPFAHFYQQPTQDSQIIRNATAGSRIIVNERDDQWLQCQFPDGEISWAENKLFSAAPKFSREELIKFAKQFLGVPYFWGGKTPLGFDCSGFVQFIHNIFNINLRRDAYIQFNDAKFISNNYLDGEAGDLCFFSENSDEITHVGFYLGNNRVLHARGMVKINSLSKNDFDFDKSLLTDFIAVKSFIQMG